MKLIRKVFAITVCLLLTFLLVSGSERVNAARKDVTNAFSDKGKIKVLSNEFRDMLGCYAGENILFDFSKKKSRQEAIKFTYKKHGKLSASD